MPISVYRHYDEDTRTYTDTIEDMEPDRKWLGFNLYIIDGYCEDEFRRLLPHYRRVERELMHRDAWWYAHPFPATVLKAWIKIRPAYWGFLDYLFNHGWIDPPANERFSWRCHTRIRRKLMSILTLFTLPYHFLCRQVKKFTNFWKSDCGTRKHG